MGKPRGYPLPEGDCYTEDTCPVVVCIPNKDEYFQAFWSTLHYLATWIAWQRDDDKRGKDAAEAWQYANQQTEVGNRMGCLEDLTNDVAAILLYLQSKKDCCDDTLTYGPSTEVGTDIEPLIGDAPDFYGETAVTDWDDWLEHVCYNAHLWVDELIRQAETIEGALAAGGIAIGLIAATLGVIGFLATGGALSIPIMMAISAALAAGGASSMFATAATDLETNRSSIVCALILGTSVSDAVEDALTISSAWTLYFQHADYDTAKAILYEGGQGTNYLPAETRDDCTGCEFPYNFDITYNFDSSAQGWVLTQFVYDAARDLLSGQVSSATCIAGKTIASLLSDIGHVGASKLEINYLEAEYENYQIASLPTDIQQRMRRPDTSYLEFDHTVPDNGVKHVHTDIFPDEELGANIEFKCFSEPGGGDQFVFLDKIRIRGWVTD